MCIKISFKKRVEKKEFEENPSSLLYAFLPKTNRFFELAKWIDFGFVNNIVYCLINV
jgi:hypothetical protein